MSNEIVLRTGWAHQNIGDVGHTPGTVRLLEQRFPDARITVWSNGLNDAVETMLRRRFPRLEIVKGHLYDNAKTCPPELAAALDRADLFLYNSGMILNHGMFSYDWNGPVYNLAPLWRCAERGTPFGIFGQSFDHFTEASLWLFRPILNSAAFIFTRETHSKRYLRELGFTAPCIEFGPDGCFGIDVRDDAAANAWIERNGLRPGHFLAAVIRTNTPVSSQHTPLNPVTPTAEHLAEDERWMGVCARVITRWVRETGLPVAVVPEAFKEIAAARNHLAPRLPPDVAAKVVLRDTWWNADEAVSFHSQARSVFGLEPHSLIMALTQRIPVVHARPLRHGRKGWMFEDIGLGDWLFDVDKADPDTVAAAVVQQHVERSSALERVEHACQQVDAAFGRALDTIAATLERRRVGSPS